MILKAGTILINKDKIGLIYRDYYKDYTFPKGHLEENETLLDCACRETNEETKREVIVLLEKEIYIDEYKDSKGNNCKCYYYLVKDNGPSDNKSLEVHDLVWTNFDEVENKLTFESLRKLWNEIKPIVKKYIKKDNTNI